MNCWPGLSTDPTDTLLIDITVPSCSARNSTSWRCNWALFSDSRASDSLLSASVSLSAMSLCQLWI